MDKKTKEYLNNIIRDVEAKLEELDKIKQDIEEHYKKHPEDIDRFGIYSTDKEEMRHPFFAPYVIGMDYEEL